MRPPTETPPRTSPTFRPGKPPACPVPCGTCSPGTGREPYGPLAGAGLCHQHAYVSSAALPAYDFLMLALREMDDELKVELLDIFLGFAACTGRSAETDWERQLRDKLTSHLPVFAGLVSSENEDIAYFAGSIVESLSQEGV